MKLQYLCHLSAVPIFLCVFGALNAEPAPTKPPAHDYPTLARVEYVTECVAKHDHRQAAVYQCACAIDRIADTLGYDDFVEAATFARYASLPGEGGGIFRDSEQGRVLAKRYRELEAAALRSCGASN